MAKRSRPTTKTRPWAHWHWPQFTAVTLLLCVRMGLIIMWLSGGVDLSPRWAVRATVIDCLLLAWVVYGWWTTHQWYLRILLWPVATLWLSGIFWVLQLPLAALTVFGSSCMGLGLALGIGLIRWLLSAGSPIPATAKILVDEAVRMKAAIAFMLAVALLVPILPAMLDPATRLAYRMEMYLTWSLAGSSVMLSLMTLFLACGTICFDISRRQVFLTLTKPVSRVQYLLGKWLGLVMLNLVLLAVTGLGIFAFARALQHQPDLGSADRQQVDNQILTARVGLPAQASISQDSIEALYQQQLQQLADTDPARYRHPDAAARQSLRQALQQSLLTSAHTLDPLGDQTFLFTNLAPAKSLGQNIQLRLAPHSVQPPPEGWVHLALFINGRPFAALKLADGLPHLVNIPADLIDPQGQLELRLANVNPANPQATFPTRIQFEPHRGLQIMFPVGRFEPNLLKALIMIWFRLGYLAMLGLAAGTFLSFPVACLVSLLTYTTALASGFLTQALEGYVPFVRSDGSMGAWLATAWTQFTQQLSSKGFWDALKIPVRMIADAFMAVVPSFSEFNPVPQISQGLWIDPHHVVESFLKIGLIWTGTLALVAWLAFRRRELATASA